MTDTNTAVGVDALAALTTATDSTALGAKALAAVTTGTQNVAIGSQAGNAATTGGSNTLVGYNTAPTLTTGSSNIIIGDGQDVPAATTSNYLNIGGVITGDMSAGYISAGPYKAPCRVATTGNLSATYSNGSSGVGATLTNSGAQSAISIDGVSLSQLDRVLVWNQTTPTQNGIYSVTTVGTGSTNWVLTRALDFNSLATIVGGSTTYVQSGTIYANTNFQMTTAGSINVGTTNIVFIGSAGTAIAGTMVKIATGSVDTSMGSATIDLRSYITSANPPTYTQLELRITGMTTNATNTNLFLQFCNQTTAVTTGQYAGASILNPTSPSQETMNNTGTPTPGVEILSAQGNVNFTDGSGTMVLNGFCNSNTAVTPNVWMSLFIVATDTTAGTTNCGISTGVVACNNVAAAIFDGLKFVANTGKFTFNWALYGIK